MKTHKYATFFIGAILFSALPGRVFAASVQITEIMYDLSGSDTNREWVEVTNISGSPVDVSGYKFFEANTNHGLTVLAGSGTLAAGQSAVIVEDQSKFMADNPSYSGAIFKASFSLSNTGEAIALKDNTLALVDTVSYTANMGASGNGDTLHRSGDTFVAGAPDPGVFSSGSSPTPAAPTDQPATPPADTSAPAQTAADPAPSLPSGASLPATPNAPPLTVRITTPSSVVVGAGSSFAGSATTAKGDSVTNVRYSWNFGDGVTSEGQRVLHTYEYPGSYAVALTVSSGYSMGVSYTTVQALSASMLFTVEADGSVVLTNQSTQNIHIGLWSIGPRPGVFIIPESTVVLPKQSIRFSPSVTRVAADANTALYYPNGTLVAAASMASVPQAIQSASATTSPISVVAASKENLSPTQGKGTKVLTSAQKIAPVPAKASPQEMAASALGALPEHSPSSSPILWESLLGLGVLVALSIAGAWYLQVLPGGESSQTSAPTSHSNQAAADDFSIDE